jgi:hypothetical protein
MTMKSTKSAGTAWLEDEGHGWSFRAVFPDKSRVKYVWSRDSHLNDKFELVPSDHDLRDRFGRIVLEAIAKENREVSIGGHRLPLPVNVALMLGKPQAVLDALVKVAEASRNTYEFLNGLERSFGVSGDIRELNPGAPKLKKTSVTVEKGYSWAIRASFPTGEEVVFKISMKSIGVETKPTMPWKKDELYKAGYANLDFPIIDQEELKGIAHGVAKLAEGSRDLDEFADALRSMAPRARSMAR